MDAAMIYSQRAEEKDGFRSQVTEADLVHWPYCLDEGGAGAGLAVSCVWRIVVSLHGTGSKLLHSKLVPFLPPNSSEQRLSAPAGL